MRPDFQEGKKVLISGSFTCETKNGCNRTDVKGQSFRILRITGVVLTPVTASKILTKANRKPS